MLKVRVATVFLFFLVLSLTFFSFSYVSSQQFLYHKPIAIYNDNQFTFENGVTGGSGTINDPFVIEGKKIFSYDTVAIFITNTTKYCTIKNNYIEGKRNNFAILIKNAGNITIDSNTIFNNSAGVRIENSKNIIVSKNSLIDNNYGIYVSNSKDIYIYSNEIVKKREIEINKDGVYLYLSSNIKVDENEIVNNDYGLWVGLSSSCSINNNRIQKSKKDGVAIYYSKDMSIQGNKIIENLESGIRIFTFSRNIIVSRNNISKNNYGIYITGSNNNVIFDNFFNNSINYLSYESNNSWYVSRVKQKNIVGGNYVGGNFWSDYSGKDLDGDGIGDTNLPYGPGDYLPLIIDNEPPETNYTVEGASIVKDSIIYLGNDSIIYLVANDKRSAIKLTFLSLDGSAWQLYRYPIRVADLSSKGHEISFYSVDVNNNVELIKKLKIFVDNLPPTIYLLNKLEGNIFVRKENNKILFIANVTDIGAGVYEVALVLNSKKYSMKSENQKLYSLEVNLTEGNYTWFFTAKDRLNNTSTFEKFNFTLVFDDEPPKILNFAFEPRIPLEGDKIKITVNVFDDKSGIKDVKLFYNTGMENDWKVVNMNLTSGVSYEANIPPQKFLTKLSFYIETEDNAENIEKSSVTSLTVFPSIILMIAAIIVILIIIVGAFLVWKLTSQRKYSYEL